MNSAHSKTFAVALAAGLSACATAAPTGKGGISVVPVLRETALTQAPGETAQGVAVWAAPDKSKSRIIGAQPQGEIALYDLNGAVVQRLSLKNSSSVDVRDSFYWLDGEGSILAASDASNASIALFKLDPKTGMASVKPRGRIRTSLNQMSAICLGQSGADQMVVAIGRNKAGAAEVHSWSLAIDPWGDATGLKLGAFKLDGDLTSCAIDDKTGALYVADAQRGIWRADIADPTGADRKLIDSVKPQGRLNAPVNALAVWRGVKGGNGQSYLLASSGPYASVLIYNGGNNRVMAEMTAGNSKDGKADAVTGGWGLGASGADFGVDAPLGLVVIQDAQNTKPKAAPNFKIVSFADIEKRIPFE